MSIKKTQNQIIASIWQAIAQSDIDLSTITQEEQKTLVHNIADSVMNAFDDVIQGQIQEDAPKERDIEDDEELVWEGRPFLSLAESYVITTDRVKIVKGFLSKHVEIFELIRIQDIDYKQSVGERLLGLGDIFIEGQDSSVPKITLRNIPHPEKVYEKLRKAWLISRKRHGLQFREYM